MKKLIYFSLALSFLLMTGCAFVHNIPAVDVSVTPPYGNKIPIKVAVVLPDANFVLTKTRGLGGGSLTETIPAGKLVRNISHSVFPYMFEEVEFVQSDLHPPGIDALLIPTIEDCRFEAKQVALGFGLKFVANVSLKGVMTDENSSPIWEQVVTVSKTSRSVVSPIIPIEQLKGEALSEAVAGAFAKLAREIRFSRDIKSYVASKGASGDKYAKKPSAQVDKYSKTTSATALKKSVTKKLFPLRSDTFTIVIGIDYKNRKDIPHLQYASNDARQVYEVLTDPRYGGVPKENAILLLNERATRNQMMVALRKIRDRDGYVYVYYSGHGAPKTKGDKFIDAYLVPSNAIVTDPEALEDTSIKMSYLQKLMDTSHAKGIMVALDACFSGGGKSIVPKGGKPLVGMLVSSEIMKPEGAGRVLITSSAANQQSWEDEAEIKGGIFTHYLLEGLMGKAGKNVWVKINELSNYVKKNVPKASRRLKGQDQYPQITGKGNFAVTRNWDVVKVKDINIARSRLKTAFENGNISVKQLSRALDALKTGQRSKTLEAYLEGKIDEENFGALY
ncbi:MAG: caspase family protein [Deltaproteobacteria bacterium]|nr:caspase family protein [Deltaproteobacteria bacterium]